MSKILYTQDIHLSGINSINRIGNYYSDCIDKIKEVISIYKEQKCELLLDCGDFYESELVSNNIVDDILDLFEENKIIFKGIFGNHGLRYNNLQASKGTSFYHMVKRSKCVNYLEQIINDKEQFIIKPYDYSHGIEEKIKKEGIVFDKKYNNYFKIVIIHAHVCEKPFPFASHVIYKDIKTNVDLILIGHVHEPNKVKIGNTTFLNIGCIGRRKINEAKIRSSCLLIDTKERSWEKIPLKSAKPPEECFDLSKVAEEKESIKNMDVFLEKVENFNFQSIDFRDKIKEYAKVTNEDNEVVTNIIERLTKVEKTNE